MGEDKLSRSRSAATFSLSTGDGIRAEAGDPVQLYIGRRNPYLMQSL
jgi:hypothetical protein